MKATEQCYSMVLFTMLHKVILTFESVDETLKCDHSNKKTIDQFFIMLFIMLCLNYSFNNLLL